MTNDGVTTNLVESAPIDASSVNILWPLTPQERPQFATNFSISRAGTEYLLEFGQVFISGLTGRSVEEIQESLQHREVDVVSRVLVSQNGLRVLVEMLQKRMKKDNLIVEEES